MLDTRQYRDNPPCGFGEAERCEAAFTTDYTMTGPAQERWLLKNLKRSDARWNVIGNQVLVAELDHDGHAEATTCSGTTPGTAIRRPATRITTVHRGGAHPEPRCDHRRLALDLRQ